MNANPYAAPRAAVSDISDSNELELAGRGVRLGAALLDGLIAFVVWIPLFFGIDWSMSPGEVPRVSTGPILLSVLLFIGWLVITIMFVARNGQTIAKKLLDIRVVRADGSQASLGRIFWLRNFVNGLLGMIPFYSIVDLLFIFGDSRQCIHDKIADTIVVVA